MDCLVPSYIRLAGRTVLAAAALSAALGGAALATASPITHRTASAGERSAAIALRGLCGALDRGVGGRGLAAISRLEMAVRAGSSSTRTQIAVERFVTTLSAPSTAFSHCVELRSSRMPHVIKTTLAAQPRALGFVVPIYEASASGVAHRSASTHVDRLIVTGLPHGALAKATDPLTGRNVAIHVYGTRDGSTTVSVRVTAYPRLITFSRPASSSRSMTGGGSSAPGGSLSTVPFAQLSPWRTPLPADAPLDPQSAAIVANLAGQVQTYYGHAALNTSSYSAPIYTVPVGQPTVNMTYNNCQGRSWVDPNFLAQLQNVPVPPSVVPSSGSDGEVVIWQPSTDTEWEFWKMAKDPATGGWSACWGGRLTNVSQNLGAFPRPYGATASGLPLLGALIRVRELQAGVINHAIDLAVVHVRAYAYSWPANRTDGGGSDPTDPAAGERFRLDPSLDLSKLNLSPGALIVARAMQQYGLIVTDGAGAVTIQAEDPRPYETNGAPDPYTASFPGHQYSWLQGIPWQDMQAVAWNYGKPAGT